MNALFTFQGGAGVVGANSIKCEWTNAASATQHNKATSRVHLAVFVDAGTVKLHHKPWLAEKQRRHLSGAGVGVYWTRARDFSVKAFYAHKLGHEDALSAPDKSGRIWLQAVKYF